MTLTELQRLRSRHVETLSSTKTPEHNQKAIDEIDRIIAKRTGNRSPLLSLPKKQRRLMGLLPPVGQYLCVACGVITPDCIGWINVNADCVGACGGCVHKATLDNIVKTAIAESQEKAGNQGLKDQHTLTTPVPKGMES